MIHYFVKANDRMIINASHILYIRRLGVGDLRSLSCSDMDRIDAAMGGTADKYYNRVACGTYELKDEANVPEVCLIRFTTGGQTYATVKRCREITGIKDI